MIVARANLREFFSNGIHPPDLSAAAVAIYKQGMGMQWRCCQGPVSLMSTVGHDVNGLFRLL
jgi:hypothetical protein